MHSMEFSLYKKMPERTNRTGTEFLMVEIRGFEPLTS